MKTAIQYLHCSIFKLKLCTHVQSQLHRLWQCVLEEEDETTSLEKIIEAKERTLALDKAIEIQVSSSSLHYQKF